MSANWESIDALSMLGVQIPSALFCVNVDQGGLEMDTSARGINVSW